MKKYLITSPNFYTDIPQVFEKKLEEQIQKHQPNFVLLRDKQTTAYIVLANSFMKVMKNHPKIKAFLHDDINLAVELNASGVHLPSYSFDKITKAKSKNLEVIVSTHTMDEVLKAEKFHANYVTYSPIFFSPNKGKPKGIENLLEILKVTNINIFALGGIVNKEEVSLIQKTKVYGFASIRYFY